MKTHKVSGLGFVLIALLLALKTGPAAMAQEAEDPPSRVARLNYSSGAVSFQPGGEGDWVTAVQNRPLTTGDNLWTDQNSRAELHVGSTAIRMNSETSLTFFDLDDHTTQLRLSLGSVLLRVRHLDDGDLLEVDTPNLAFNVQSVGEYRIDVNGDGNQTITTVWHGRGEASGGGYSYTVVAGQQAMFNGTDQLDHQIAQIPASDDFENFAFARDRREDGPESSNYISAEMTGYEDLDDYGRWHYVADYGPVWTPNGVAGDWAPYRYGHWVWVAPWGWTWVEDEPWGFAPFHYGRWAYVENGWCWVPGPVVVRPVYAPALVAFVGGGGFRLSLGVGEGVAWFPLGPREVYVPPYRVSRTYVNQVNITNTRVNSTQVTNVYNTTNVTKVTYVNQRVPNGVTAVSQQVFSSARPVDKNLARVDARQLSEAPINRGEPVQPTRSSVLGAGTPARAKPPAAIENRRVIATRNPTPPRVSFDQRQAASIRTETPGRPAPNANPSPEQGGNSPPERESNTGARTGASTGVPRFQQPANARSDESSNVPRSSEPKRAPESPQVSRAQENQRPETARPDNPRQREQNIRPPQANENRNNHERADSAPIHPLVRPAPPVESRPQVDQNEANKFRTWQQQRPANVPRPPANRPEQNRPPQNSKQEPKK
jgi:hypothetical protein